MHPLRRNGPLSRSSAFLAVVLAGLALSATRVPAQPAPAIPGVNDSTFDAKVLKSRRPVLVVAWAEWCGPCRMVSASVGELAAQPDSRVQFVAVDADHAAKTIERLHITNLPTFVLFKDGIEAGRQVGATPKDKLASWITQTMGP